MASCPTASRGRFQSDPLPARPPFDFVIFEVVERALTDVGLERLRCNLVGENVAGHVPLLLGVGAQTITSSRHRARAILH
jgi:hypothetical protein